MCSTEVSQSYRFAMMVSKSSEFNFWVYSISLRLNAMRQPKVTNPIIHVNKNQNIHIKLVTVKGSICVVMSAFSSLQLSWNFFQGRLWCTINISRKQRLSIPFTLSECRMSTESTHQKTFSMVPLQKIQKMRATVRSLQIQLL